MSSPTNGPDGSQGGGPQGQPGWGPPPPQGGYGPPQPHPGWGPQPAQGGYGAAPGYGAGPGARRPGAVTAAGVVGIVIGALVALLNLLGLALADDVLVEVTALDVLLSVLAIAAGVALVAGGIQVLRNAAPHLLLFAAYGTAAVWVINLVVVLSRGDGFAGAGLLLIVGAAVIAGLLRGASAQRWYGGRAGV
ncbi:hypothetical protein [Blastococcus xanthinilyticus]|uniref:Uncharacterized protein n=1 Tax=Blastococcus xanthinilyticus TaxID=1564164 RepID=A0A5S5CSQ5_9ACTN|nr:hypothetical protein [Blastococcus xanthinilyticus]TYP85968.1 hypothetical protein BD833_111109 [Blastococcus xanthinilyticus]